MPAPSSRPRPCHRRPIAAEVTQRHLLGLWRAQFQGLAQGATLLLEKHGKYAQSVSGAINRNGERARVAGDVEDGGFTLEESIDGINISATWSGTVKENSCGTHITGSRQSVQDPSPREFVLRKQPGSP
jgi:hypothetical protein